MKSKIAETFIYDVRTKLMQIRFDNINVVRGDEINVKSIFNKYLLFVID